MKGLTLLFALFALAGGPAGAAVTPVPSFEHVVVVVFENKEWASVLGSGDAPTFKAYARRYANLTRYYGLTHPSLPNYIALVSGSTHKITDDCTDCAVNGTSLADTLETAGRSWKVYAESLPQPGFLGAESGRYVKRHNPFVYFRNISGDPARRARIVPLTQLGLDLQARRLPDFSFVLPDMCDSMHDCPVSVGDAWLARTVPPLLKLPRTVVFVLFDEGTTKLRGGGHTVALALGTAVRPHSRFTAITGHYGVLRTIEQAWRLPRLGRSATARPITGIWRSG